MSPGKLAAQTGHAFLDTYDLCRKEYPDRAKDYHNGSHGTKIVLSATLEEILAAQNQANEAGIPCALITDSGHIMPPHFTGAPIITALGIGPARRDEIEHITNQFQLVR